MRAPSSSSSSAGYLSAQNDVLMLTNPLPVFTIWVFGQNQGARDGYAIMGTPDSNSKSQINRWILDSLLQELNP
jgi:hypothetical protein